jgi:hypothetical protein
MTSFHVASPMPMTGSGSLIHQAEDNGVELVVRPCAHIVDGALDPAVEVPYRPTRFHAERGAELSWIATVR